jgi:hypothetical protein
MPAQPRQEPPSSSSPASAPGGSDATLQGPGKRAIRGNCKVFSARAVERPTARRSNGLALIGARTRILAPGKGACSMARIAVAQIDVTLGDVAGNLACARGQIRAAASQGADSFMAKPAIPRAVSSAGFGRC